MTDPRRVTLAAPHGVPDAAMLPSRPHVVVVGAGIAGLTAATGLAERGVTVDVVEQCRHPRALLPGVAKGYTAMPGWAHQASGR